MKRYKSLIYLLVTILAVIIFFQFLEPAIGSFLTTILTSFTTIIGIFSVFYEMKRSADIEECDFILELFKHFTSNTTPGIAIIYEKLDMLFSENKNMIIEEDRKNMVEYLQFFEMLAVLVNKDAISLEDVNELFGYWFFIAVNCKTVQDMEIIPNKDYYKGIYELYPKWYNLAKKKKDKIPFEETLLIK